MVEWLKISDLFKYAIYQNRWLWFHVLGGGFLAKLIMLASHNNTQLAINIVFSLAITWEILEYIFDDVKKTYGSKKRFVLDAIGDIVGAVAMAIIVIW